MTQPTDTEYLTPLVTDQSMSADFTTPYSIVHGWDNGSLVMSWTGASSTTALLLPEASNDAVNWCKLIATSQAKKVDDVAGCQMYLFSFFSYKYFRFRFSKQSETTGLMTVSLYVSRFFGRNR
jgi:hypothetical protein